MPLNPVTSIHRIFGSGWFLFIFFLISTFCIAFHFLLHFLSHTVFIVMCSAIKAHWWLWHSVSRVTLAEALLSRKRLESLQRWELVKKKFLFFHCLCVQLLLSLINDHFLDPRFCSPSVFLIILKTQKPKFTVLNWQGQIHVTGGQDSALWRHLRLLNQAPK